MFSTIFTQTLQLKRRTYLFVATLLTTMVGIGGAQAQLLENEFIISFQDVFKTKLGKLCIVMDYADGGDLYTKIAN